MDSCFSGLPTPSLTSSDRTAGSLSGSLAGQKTLQLDIRTARLPDLNGLAEVLTQSFHPPVGLMSWAYPLLKLGIQEDLRSRLQEASPHYLCLTAITLPKNRNSPEKTPPTRRSNSEKSLNQVTRENREIVGTIELALRSSGALGKTQCAYISNLAVSQSYRRQGIARKLLLSCEPMALNWGFREIYLHVLEDNQQARQLYSSSGYRLYRVDSSLESWLFNRPRRLLLHKRLH